VHIGHVHLRSSDIERTRASYADVVGFEVTVEGRGIPGRGTVGDVALSAALVSARLARGARDVATTAWL
jgi:catechol-2,3-dioxygenase